MCATRINYVRKHIELGLDISMVLVSEYPVNPDSDFITDNRLRIIDKVQTLHDAAEVVHTTPDGILNVDYTSLPVICNENIWRKTGHKDIR